MSIRLVIGCHSYLLGEGLKKLLEDERAISTIGIFNEERDLKDIIGLKPDLLLTDSEIFFNFSNNLLVDNKLKILLIGSSNHSKINGRLQELLSKGVVGILPPAADSRLLKKAIKAVSSGELWIDRKTMKDILSSKNAFGDKINLTRAEKDVVVYLCQGYRNKEIAQKLDISEQTVKSHCNRIYKKVGVSDRLQLVLNIYRLWPELIPKN